MSDILVITFLKIPQNTFFLQCKKSSFTPIKMKGIFDLLVDETFHWSQNKDFFS